MPCLNMAVHKVSLDLFQEAGMEALVARSKRLTAYLETLVHIVAERTGAHLEILTPTDSQAWGASSAWWPMGTVGRCLTT